MAKPGDIVEFRAGLHGIAPPQNIGIFVRRWKRKGTPWVELITVSGRHELKGEHLSRRAFKARYEGNLAATDEAISRVKFLITSHSEGNLIEEVEDDLERLETDLWRAASELGDQTEEQLAKLLYEQPSHAQLKQVRAALQGCRQPGQGSFQATAKGDVWRAWTLDEVEQMRAAWSDLEALRRALIATSDSDEGRVFSRIDISSAAMDDSAKATLGWACKAMEQFIEYDGIPPTGVQGIGGLAATKAFGMDLHRTLGFLAMDWIRSEHTTRSSDYVHFLIETGQWTPENAVAGLMRRHVNREQFFEHVPDEQAASAALELPEPKEGDPGRKDLRHLECYTIDPPDAKDFDDAVGIESGPEGGHYLWVHIADVSHYVVPGTHLDRHAKNRATSVYLPGRVLPMLPARIADHLCSLRADGDRYALSVRLEVDESGQVVGRSMHKSLIRVNANLAYDDALARAEAGEEPFAGLLALAQLMRIQRRGIAIETGEVRISLSASGFEAHEKFATPATQMIEMFMVAANEAVAQYMHEHEAPLLHRCHPLPDATKAEKFRHQLETMGVSVEMDLPKAAGAQGGGQSLLDQLKAGGGSINLFGGGMQLNDAEEPDEEPANDAKPTGFAAMSRDEQDAWLTPFRNAAGAIEKMSSRPRAEVATMKMLGCMGRAYYAPENDGHFGLASSFYCHFTSPIRRYPDLVTHRNLKWLIGGQEGPIPHAFEDLQRMCDHCSQQERAASDLERRIKSSAMVLSSLHGESSFSEAPARIAGIVPGGVFVALGAGLDARVSMRDLPGAPYEVDEWESMLFHQPTAPGEGNWVDPELGEERSVVGRLGDPVSVRLAGRDVAEGKTSAQLAAWS